MKPYPFLTALTAVLALGLYRTTPSAQAQRFDEGRALAASTSPDNRSWSVAEAIQPADPIQTLPNAGEVRFRAVTYQRSESRSDPRLEDAIRREFSTDNLRFLYGSIDLNEDGRPEVIVYPISICGTGGCPMLVLQSTESGFKRVSRHTLVNSPIVVSRNKTNGWRDFVLYVAGGGAKPGYHTLKFNGSTYPSNPSTAPVVVPGSIVSGTAVIADQISPQIGLVLGKASPQSGLSAEQQTALKALGIPVAVPSVVPTGYAVSKVETTPCQDGVPRSEKGVCRFGPQYAIVYRHTQLDRCFAVEATGGGVGGVPAEYEVKIKTALLGETSLLFGQQNGEFKTPTAQQLSSYDQLNLLTDWAGKGPFYRISGADVVRQAYYSGASTQCKNTISPSQAIQLVQSLTWLK